MPFFEPRAVVCHAGYDERRYGSYRREWLARSLETWGWMAARVREEGSRLMLENVYEGDPDDMKDLFLELKHLDVGFCLDTGHMTAFGRGPLDRWLDALGPHLGHLHLHDNLGRWDEHLALGRGEFDFKRLFEFLQKKEMELPLITLEPHREEDLLLSLEYLRKNRLL